jgi:hypothetical protein
LGSPGSSKTFATSGSNKSLPEEHKEKPSKTTIENNKVKFDVDQTKETSKMSPEVPLKQTLLHKKIQEQARQDQLRANLLPVYDKIMVVNNIECDRQESSKTFPTSGTNKSLPEEHKEKPSKTKIENNKVEFDVGQTKETSKRPPEDPLKQALLHNKLQEQSRKEQLRANLLRVYDKIMVVNSIECAKQVVQKLTTDYRDFFHACDTEVSQHSISMYFIMSSS